MYEDRLSDSEILRISVLKDNVRAALDAMSAVAPLQNQRNTTKIFIVKICILYILKIMYTWILKRAFISGCLLFCTGFCLNARKNVLRAEISETSAFQQ